MDNMNIEEIVRDVLVELTRFQEGNLTPAEADDTIPVEMSARHVHLSEKDALALFGTPLTPVRELSQPGQYLCKERVRLIGPKGVMDNVAVLGPARDLSQVEISLTDARSLGLDVPIRQSGDVQGTPGILLSSGSSIVPLDQGVIVAGRHIHMSPDDARRLDVRDRELTAVLMEGRRPAVFRDVLVRVHKDFRLAMHIDADEANGCGCGPGTRCRIVKDPVKEAGNDRGRLN
ncbi:MAG: phosphate propanoyltransferase [Desulfobacter sp.]|nr:MAG: phosphate propanoyltransferase [Desulfobacter sp.]